MAASGQSRPSRSKAWRSTRRSKRALWATSTRPRAARRARAVPPRAGGAASTIPWVMPVKRWMPRDSGRSVRTSESNVSCSSPPPTSTAPTSVISQRSPPSPLVSVSTATNSAGASGCASRDTNDRCNSSGRTDRNAACAASRRRPAASRPEGAKPSARRLSFEAMARSATVFACSSCGHESPKWHGRCPGCGEWNTLAEETRSSAPAGRGGGSQAARAARLGRSSPCGWRGASAAGGAHDAPGSASSTGCWAAGSCPARSC